MIVRIWHGRTRIEDATSYEVFMRQRAALDYVATPGFRRAVFTRRDENDEAHFLLVTFWDDMEAVKAFSGLDPEKARYYPEDDRFLLKKEPQALNYQVFFDSDLIIHLFIQKPKLNP